VVCNYYGPGGYCRKVEAGVSVYFSALIDTVFRTAPSLTMRNPSASSGRLVSP
jgi:hypothetical protein